MTFERFLERRRVALPQYLKDNNLNCVGDFIFHVAGMGLTYSQATLDNVKELLYVESAPEPKQQQLPLKKKSGRILS